MATFFTKFQLSERRHAIIGTIDQDVRFFIPSLYKTVGLPIRRWRRYCRFASHPKEYLWSNRFRSVHRDPILCPPIVPYGLRFHLDCHLFYIHVQEIRLCIGLWASSKSHNSLMSPNLPSILNSSNFLDRPTEPVLSNVAPNLHIRPTSHIVPIFDVAIDFSPVSNVFRMPRCDYEAFIRQRIYGHSNDDHP